jgi:hypothetical protein
VCRCEAKRARMKSQRLAHAGIVAVGNACDMDRKCEKLASLGATLARRVAASIGLCADLRHLAARLAYRG